MMLRRSLLLAVVTAVIVIMAGVVIDPAFAQTSVGGNNDPTMILERALAFFQGRFGLLCCLIGLIITGAMAVFSHNHRGFYGVGALTFVIFCGGWFYSNIVGFS